MQISRKFMSLWRENFDLFGKWLKIYCDKDYLSLLGKTRMSGLSRAENQIYRCILEAEEYWVRDMKSAGTRIFHAGFHDDIIDNKVKESREGLKNG